MAETDSVKKKNNWTALNVGGPAPANISAEAPGVPLSRLSQPHQDGAPLQHQVDGVQAGKRGNGSPQSATKRSKRSHASPASATHQSPSLAPSNRSLNVRGLSASAPPLPISEDPLKLRILSVVSSANDGLLPNEVSKHLREDWPDKINIKTIKATLDKLVLEKRIGKLAATGPEGGKNYRYCMISSQVQSWSPSVENSPSGTQPSMTEESRGCAAMPAPSVDEARASETRLFELSREELHYDKELLAKGTSMPNDPAKTTSSTGKQRDDPDALALEFGRRFLRLRELQSSATKLETERRASDESCGELRSRAREEEARRVGFCDKMSRLQAEVVELEAAKVKSQQAETQLRSEAEEIERQERERYDRSMVQIKEEYSQIVSELQQNMPTLP